MHKPTPAMPMTHDLCENSQPEAKYTGDTQFQRQPILTHMSTDNKSGRVTTPSNTTYTEERTKEWVKTLMMTKNHARPMQDLHRRKRHGDATS